MKGRNMTERQRSRHADCETGANWSEQVDDSRFQKATERTPGYAYGKQSAFSDQLLAFVFLRNNHLRLLSFGVNRITNLDLSADAFMKDLTPTIGFFVVLLLLTMTPQCAVAQQDIGEVLRPALVTAEILESKIAETEATADLPDETKTELVELYRRALSNRQQASANAERSAAFKDAARTAPTQAELIEEKIDAAETSDPLATLDASLEIPLEDLERLLQKERADLAAVTARHAELERRLADGKDRPTVIRQRLAEAAQQQEENAAELRVAPDSVEKPVLAQARRWVLQTRNGALSDEIKMLNQELLSQRMRMDLLEAKRDREAGKILWIGSRVEMLSELVNSKRQLEAEEAKTEVEEMRLATVGSDPLLTKLANWASCACPGDLLPRTSVGGNPAYSY